MFQIDMKRNNQSWSVSRILYPDIYDVGTVIIHLVPASRSGSRNLPESRSEAGYLMLFYLILHRMGFTELPTLPSELVVSYTTVSPLPRSAGRRIGVVYFLLHFPCSPTSVGELLPLGGILPCGVRTFLLDIADDIEAITRPTLISKSVN